MHGIKKKEQRGFPEMLMHFMGLLESSAGFPKPNNSAQDPAEATQPSLQINEMEGGEPLCKVCQSFIDDDCCVYRLNKWHKSCVQCSLCETRPSWTSPPILEDIWVLSGVLYCSSHVPVVVDQDALIANGVRGHPRTVTKLEQYAGLLGLALKRLCQILGVEYPREFNLPFNKEEDF